MIIVPNEKIIRAAILTLQDAISRGIPAGAKLLKKYVNKRGLMIPDQAGNKMYCLNIDKRFLLNNLNGPAFVHHSGKEILFILDKGFSPVEYQNNFYVKYIKQIRLANPEEPVVSSGTYNLDNGGTLELSTNSKATKFSFNTYNSNYYLHTDSEDIPAVVDFIYDKAVKWYKNGKLHRTNGPAVIRRFDPKTGGEGRDEYWINGELHSKQSFDEYFSGIESQADKDMLTDLGQSFD